MLIVILASAVVGHDLTCPDSVAKVGTQFSLLRVLETDSKSIQDLSFHKLDNEMIERAEIFFVKDVAIKAYAECLSFDELRLKLYKNTRDKNVSNSPAHQMKFNKI